MKKCPICERTFDDGMRFCQTDGTPLVDDAPALDPYKTMVAKPGEIAAAMAADEPVPAPHDTDDVLQLPSEPDPLKTMYASEDEIRNEMRAQDAREEQVIDIPPLAPEPPKFSEPSLSPPPSPFSPAPSSEGPGDSPFQKTTPPIPSPFVPKPPAPEPPPPTPNFQQFHDPEPPPASASANPFDQPSSATPDWTPPTPAIEPRRQQENMQNQPMSPAPSAAGGANKTLPIISLVAGIVSLCCYVSPLTGLVALITGFLGMKNANNDPANYGGKGLAIAGMVTGGLFLLIGLAYWIFLLFFGGLGIIMNMLNQQ